MASGAGPATAGLFGKLPAHGDFVRRGWGDDTVDRLDAWAAEGLARLRARVGEAGEAVALRAAPAWFGRLPAGVAGEDALLLVLAPSADRVGRLFLLTLGFAGAEAAVAAAAARPGLRALLDGLLYDAVAGRLDADGVVARLAAEMGGREAPAGHEGGTGWWPLDRAAHDAPVVPATLDAAAFDRLLVAPA